MSRAQRRASRPGSARSRRTPVRPRSSGGGMQLPWIPIVVVVGVAAIIGVVIYLVIEAGKPAGNRFEEAARVEEQFATSTTLPGQGVNLPEIYADGSTLAHYGQDSSVGPNTNAHVTRDVDYTAQGLPPAGGPHWNGNCGQDPKTAPAFCGPVPNGIYRDPWNPESLVHNMEHAGLVIWYNTTSQETIAELEDFASDNDNKQLVLTPLPEMEPETIAITVWGRRDKFPVAEYSRDRLDDFIDKLYCRFDPEGFC